jgi:ubiquinone/menaquinone biosynthesis C-methylase UbiE
MLRECGIHPGMTVLDFGCGLGSFSLAAARLVGKEGFVYALDIHPLAVKMVRRAVEKYNYINVETVLGKDITVIQAGSIDFVILYDVLHDIQELENTLAEINRTLKSDGTLSVRDHHLQEAPLLVAMTEGGFFRLRVRNRRAFQFEKIQKG